MAAEQHLSAKQLTAMTANILHAGFIKRNKAVAKKDFKKLAAGEQLDVGAMTQKQTGDEIRLTLSMEASEFKGMLTFSLFQKALDAMLSAIARHQDSEKGINTFTNDKTNQMVFFVPGFVEHDDVLNMLVCGVKTGKNELSLQLMFLDPEQFRKLNEEEPSAQEDGSTGSVEAAASALASELSELAEELGEDIEQGKPA